MKPLFESIGNQSEIKLSSSRVILIKDMDPYLKIDEACIACEWCKYTCPVENCITFETAIASIDHHLCIECGSCIFVCPIEVIIPLREPQDRTMGDKNV
jgi:NAD-dependent dihydropyrimidine dehydrogenase PreA subunit